MKWIMKWSKKFIDEVIKDKTNPEDFVLSLYKTLYEDEWDHIKELEGFPHCSQEMAEYIMGKAMENDKAHYPGTMPTSLTWFNHGFGVDGKLKGWEVKKCKYEKLTEEVS